MSAVKADHDAAVARYPYDGSDPSGISALRSAFEIGAAFARERVAADIDADRYATAKRYPNPDMHTRGFIYGQSICADIARNGASS